MTTAALKLSLRLWLRRLAYRQAALAKARTQARSGAGAAKAGVITHAEAARIHKWERLVADAERNVGRRRRQIANRQPTARRRAIAHAASFAGKVRESPPGSNSGGIITVWCARFGFGRVPWCGIFCANVLLYAGVKGITSRLAACIFIEDDARAGRAPFGGWTRDPSSVRAGDLVLLFGRGVHVELVDRVAGGVVHTIGGNTSAGTGGSQSNGGGVYRRARPLSAVHGFALVHYPGRTP
jgi:hypothetical protein